MHVDDPAIVFKKSQQGQEDEKWFFDQLRERFTIKEVHELAVGSPIDYCSIRITLLENGDLTLDNQACVEKIVAGAGLTDCNAATMPISKSMLKTAAEQREDEDYVTAEEKTLHEHYIGEFNWLNLTTHPSIAVATSIMGSYNGSPSPENLNMCKHMVRYLKGTATRGLVRVFQDNSGVECWCDSDHAGLHGLTGERRSRLGFLITYNGMPVIWKSVWIKAICTSSGEAETYALSEALKALIYICNVGSELGIKMESRPRIHVDATAALGFAAKTKGVGRMKHIDLREGWVRQLLSADKADLVKVDGKMNKADQLTKILGRSEFQAGEDELMPILKP